MHNIIFYKWIKPLKNSECFAEATLMIINLYGLEKRRLHTDKIFEKAPYLCEIGRNIASTIL